MDLCNKHYRKEGLPSETGFPDKQGVHIFRYFGFQIFWEKADFFISDNV